MMFPPNFLTVERISCANTAGSKKRVLEEVGRLLAASTPDLTQDKVFDKLLERERLGSTGLGHGIALPHARMAGVEQAWGAFIQLSDGVDFDAIDNKKIDLAFGLLVPEEATQEHLNLLAKLATLFANSDLCKQLRQAKSEKQIYKLIQEWEQLAQTA